MRLCALLFAKTFFFTTMPWTRRTEGGWKSQVSADAVACLCCAIAPIGDSLPFHTPVELAPAAWPGQVEITVLGVI